VGFDAKPKQTGVAIEWESISSDRELTNLGCGEDRVVGQTRVQTAADDLKRLAERENG
jgi:hypothetical protein